MKVSDLQYVPLCVCGKTIAAHAASRFPLCFVAKSLSVHRFVAFWSFCYHSIQCLIYQIFKLIKSPVHHRTSKVSSVQARHLCKKTACNFIPRCHINDSSRFNILGHSIQTLFLHFVQQKWYKNKF